jgi:DNA processing protein
VIKSLSYKEKLQWLSLARVEGIGSKTFFKLLDKYKSVENALGAVPSIKTKSGNVFKLQSSAFYEKEIENIEKYGARLIAFCEPEYPAGLRNIYDPPPLITVRGQVDCLNKKAVAIVGTRNSSIHSMNFTKQIAKEIGRAGYYIVSGLARGIDTAAHTASLETGTIAVMACGINKIYPPENEKLAEKIIENGIIISETPFGSMPRAENFPMRNRIVSGLSEGVVVVEAAKRSGSLITARLAAEQGREVMAVPGFPGDLRSEGNNYLLKNGATLVTSAEDILEAVVNISDHKKQFNELKENPELYKLADDELAEDEEGSANDIDNLIMSLSACPVNIEDLIQSSPLSAQKILSLVSELELNKKIVRTNGNMIALIEA